jgi:hypothetical protein
LASKQGGLGAGRSHAVLVQEQAHVYVRRDMDGGRRLAIVPSPPKARFGFQIVARLAATGRQGTAGSRSLDAMRLRGVFRTSLVVQPIGSLHAPEASKECAISDSATTLPLLQSASKASLLRCRAVAVDTKPMPSPTTRTEWGGTVECSFLETRYRKIGGYANRKRIANVTASPQPQAPWAADPSPDTHAPLAAARLASIGLQHCTVIRMPVPLLN